MNNEPQRRFNRKMYLFVLFHWQLNIYLNIKKQLIDLRINKS